MLLFRLLSGQVISLIRPHARGQKSEQSLQAASFPVSEEEPHYGLLLKVAGTRSECCSRSTKGTRNIMVLGETE